MDTLCDGCERKIRRVFEDNDFPSSTSQMEIIRRHQETVCKLVGNSHKEFFTQMVPYIDDLKNFFPTKDSRPFDYMMELTNFLLNKVICVSTNDLGIIFHKAAQDCHLSVLNCFLASPTLDLSSFNERSQIFFNLLKKHQSKILPHMCDRNSLIYLQEFNVISDGTVNFLESRNSSQERFYDLFKSMTHREFLWYELFLLVMFERGACPYMHTAHEKIEIQHQMRESRTCIFCKIQKECNEFYELTKNIGQGSSRQALLDSDSDDASEYFSANGDFSSSIHSKETRLLETDAAVFDDLLSSSDSDSESYDNKNEEPLNPLKVGEPLTYFDYQITYTATAVKGENDLICAPTGSGKTHMALRIIIEHLERRGKDARVLFIVHRTNLANQQYRLLQNHLNVDRVTKLHGGEKNSLTMLLRGYQVIVVTAGIVLNTLKEPNDSTLSKVTLMIFDEAHNCDGDSPYNEIMSFYHQRRLHPDLPQIVGLTAMPAAGKKAAKTSVQDKLTILLANLDCFHISYLSQDEFAQYSKAQNLNIESKSVPIRAKNWLDNELQKLMEKCEQHIRQISPQQVQENLEPIPDMARSSNEYTSFVGRFQSSKMLFPANKTEHIVDFEAMFQILDKLHQSLMIYELFSAANVKHFLAKKLEEFKHSYMGRTVYKDIQTVLNNASRNETMNPCLEELKSIILTQMRSNSASRVLVFVKKRSYTYFLRECLCTDSRFGSVKVEAIIGANESGQGIGNASKNAQNQVLQKFRNGTVNILIATTVVEEGLDVPECNLVIRYVHVTDAVGMVQSRGRARAKHSKYIVIFPSDQPNILQRELANEHKSDLMYEEIREMIGLSLSNPRKFKQSIEECQLDQFERVQLNQQNRIAIPQSQADPNQKWQFRCKKCNSLAFMSDTIRKADHYFSVDPTISERTWEELSNAGVYVVYCKGQNGNVCDAKWGERKTIKGCPRFMPYLPSFNIRNANENAPPVRRSTRNWKAVEEFVYISNGR